MQQQSIKKYEEARREANIDDGKDYTYIPSAPSIEKEKAPSDPKELLSYARETTKSLKSVEKTLNKTSNKCDILKTAISEYNKNELIIDNIEKSMQKSLINEIEDNEIYEKSNYYNWSQNV